jgi:hypothetical protein
MKINEIITESTELEEGWKSKLGAAALAGAAAFGGGGSDAQAQNYQQPTAQTQQVLRLSSQDVKLARQIGELSVLMNDAKFRSIISPEQKRIYDNGYSTLQSRWGKFGQADNQYLENLWKSGRNVASLREFYGRANMPRSNGDLDRWLDEKFGTRSPPQLSSGGVKANLNGQSLGSQSTVKQDQSASTSIDQVPQLNAPDQKYYTAMTNDLRRDITAVKNALSNPQTVEQKIELKRQVDSAISSYVKGFDEAVRIGGFNKDAVKILNKQLDQLKSLGSSIKP